MEAWQSELIALAQVIIIDLVLAGDNAIVVGIAASRVAPELRARVIFWGIAGAVVLRVTFAAVTVQLLSIVGLTLAGGILLLWVCWKVYREVARDRHHQRKSAPAGATAVTAEEPVAAPLGFWSAMLQIIVADVSMSLDNVLAVAGAARDHTWVLVVGLAISIVLMALAANIVARLLSRFPWMTWLGLLIILYVAIDMIWRGAIEVSTVASLSAWTPRLMAIN
jgi:YjbE family integral membrane protein